jgi:hypothetical protein
LEATADLGRKAQKKRLRLYENQKTKIQISPCIMLPKKKNISYLPTLSANSYLNAKLGNEKLHPMIVHFG